MRLRSRLMLFFLVIVLGPAAGGVFMGRQMAERQSTARADGRLEGASIAVVHALNQQVAQAMQRLTASVALHALGGGPPWRPSIGSGRAPGSITWSLFDAATS